MSKSKVLFIMTGSIACYKACGLISKLVQNNYDVQVVATNSALKFVGNSTLEGLSGKPALTDLYSLGHNMEHIHLMNWADLIIVAPATANYINKISSGLGDDLASTLFLAYDFKKPLLIAPAMNTKMYLNPVTQKSVTYLKSIGINILETASGVLACGEEGLGKLLDPELIYNEIQTTLKVKHGINDSNKIEKQAPQHSEKILITAGGTIEPIDGVRNITNTSTGQTGSEIADFLFELGFDVELLISASSNYKNNKPYKVKEFTNFSSLENLIHSCLSINNYTAIFHAAAVSDFSLAEIEVNGECSKPSTNSKLKTSDSLTLRLKRNPKIVDHIKEFSKNKNIKLFAFKLTQNADKSEVLEAINKLFNSSHADFIIHNDLNQINKIKKQHSFNLFENTKQIYSNFTKAELFAFIAQNLNQRSS